MQFVFGSKGSEAWTVFAAQATRNHSGLPRLTSLTAEKNSTMIFDNERELRSNFDKQPQDIVSRD
jgi:carboxylesterase type B